MRTAQQRIERAKVSMIRDNRFAYLAGIFMLGDTTLTDDIPTASTNGRDVLFNPQFVENLTESELRGLVYHEYGGHIMMRHLNIYKDLYKKDPRTANMACDYVVNQLIVDYNDPNFISLPAGGLQDSRFRGMDSKQVFNILYAENKDSGGGEGGSMDHHDWESAEQLTEQEQRTLAEDIDAAVRQSVTASKLLGHPVDRAIEDWLTPKIDWETVLRDFMITACSGADQSTYRKPRRRMLSDGLYMPTTYAQTVKDVVIAVDASISTFNQTDLTKYLTEVGAVCDTVKPEMLHLLYWGTRVVGHERYSVDQLESLRSSTKPKSGGGTDVNCVTQYMQEMSMDPTCVIVLTDGYLAGSWGDWPCPVLWGITTNRIAPVGVTMHL